MRLRPAPAAILVAALLAAPARPAESAAPGPEAGARTDDAVSITFSGGSSLGAYEAGLAWGIVRFLRLAAAADGDDAYFAFFRPRLAASTGASAGAVNAMLAAALWCERPGPSLGVDGNLLQETWLSVDLGELLPADPAAYAPRDALLSPATLERAAGLLREQLFGPAATGRYRPGCRVPVGFTVTRVEPLQREVAGLPTASQRFVLPWLLEAGPDGRLSVRRHPLPRGEIAEAALDLEGIPDRAGGDFQPAAAAEAILASGAVPVAFAPRLLCARGEAGPSCREYVDGGVFDNVPMGLAIDLVDAARAGAILHPVTSFLVDPDRRRPQAVEQRAAGARSGAAFARNLRLLGDLASTARGAELSRAIRSRGWNRTTQRVLRDYAAASAETAEVHAALGHLGGAPEGTAPPGSGGPATPLDRPALARALAACLDRMAQAVAAGNRNPLPCAASLAKARLAEGSGGRLEAADVVRLAEQLDAFLRAARGRTERGPGRDELRAAQPALAAGLWVVSSALLFLAEEVDRVGASGLPEPRLRRFREAVLEPVRSSAGASRLTSQLVNALLEDQLEAVARGAPPAVAAAARQARAQVAALPFGQLFDPAGLQDLAGAVGDALARGAWAPEEVAARWQAVSELLEVRERLRRLVARGAALALEAGELASGDGTEHALVVSTRFAPLAGSQLGGFGGFLDRPLRRYDYYAGVYEALHAIGVALCQGTGADARLHQPSRLARDPSRLDLEARDTQRCLGEAMRIAAEALEVRRSPGARHVVAGLAELELAASLRSRAAAAALRSEPSWAWLGELAAPLPGDPVAATLAALTGRRAPCREGEEEPLCPAELGFEEFLGALAAEGYASESPGMALALRDADLWWAEVLRRITGRALAVEQRALGSGDDPLGRAAVAGLSAAELITRRAAERGPEPRFQLDPSTLPSAPLLGQRSWRLPLARLVPYRLALDVARGGFAVAWLEPAVRLRPWLSLHAIAEPVQVQAADRRWSSSVGALAAVHLGGVTAGAGPRWWFPWRGAAALGAEARISVLQERLSLGVGLRSLDAAARGASWFVTLGVSDLNGSAFWLTPLSNVP